MRCAAFGDDNGVYNLASGVETSILELAEAINELTGNAAGVSLEPARDWDHSGKRYGATDKAERELGFACSVPLRDGVDRTVAWTRENRDRIENCVAQHTVHMT